jgi:hypothetical protein
LEYGGALLRRFGFSLSGFCLGCWGSGVRQCFALPLWFLVSAFALGRSHPGESGKTNAAEQTAAALQTKPPNPLFPASQKV